MVVAAALFLESEGVGVGLLLDALIREKGNLNISFPLFFCHLKKKLNCDDKDLAIELKPWTLYEITAQVLNSNLVSLCWEREIIAT